jgi:salicylate hydroxylase
VVPREALPEPFRAPLVGAWIGREGHIVHYPVIGGFAVNLVAIVADPSPSGGWGDPAKADAVRTPFKGWAKDVRDALAVPGETWRTWALHDRPPLRRWSRGPITLIGDAAHPMLPFLAQGGAMGIEDAHALAEEMIVQPGRADLAFEAFWRQRIARTLAMQKAARKNGRIFHMAGPSAMVRDLVLNMMPEPLLIRRQDWIYGFRK